MPDKMQQYKRDKLYLPVASPTSPQPMPTGDYQSYKKESAFRRLVSGALRTTERQKARPDVSELEDKRQALTANLEALTTATAEDEKRKRRSRHKSTRSEAPRQASRDRQDSRRDDRRHSRQSMRHLELKPLASNPVYPPMPSDGSENVRPVDDRRHSKRIPRTEMKQSSSARVYDKELNPPPRTESYEIPRPTYERHYSSQSARRPELRQLSSNTVSNDGPRQTSAKGHDYRRDGRCYSTKSMMDPYYVSTPASMTRETSNFSRPFNQDQKRKSEHRATVDARRPYTTERLSRGSYSSRQRE